ncbi:MAG: hypothetical protein IKK75_05535 [Clostridia bacterium]|nr:hypothetical protein [Clostridia bacterium]
MRKWFICISALVLLLLLCIAPSGAVGERITYTSTVVHAYTPWDGRTVFPLEYTSESVPLTLSLSYTDENGTEVTKEFTTTDPLGGTTFIITRHLGREDETLQAFDLHFDHVWAESGRQYTAYAYSPDRTLRHGPIVYEHNWVSQDQPFFLFKYVDGLLKIHVYFPNQKETADLYRSVGDKPAVLFVSDIVHEQGVNDTSLLPGQTYTYYLVAKDGKGAFDTPLTTLSITIPEAVAP